MRLYGRHSRRTHGKALLRKASLAAVAAMFVGVVAVALPVAAATPQEGGTLIFGRGADSDKLDPADVTDGESLKVTRQIFEGFVRYNKYDTTVEPSLATSWETSDDGLVWTFHLRKGVKFHDGTPFNADAVVFNFERWMDVDNPYHDGAFVYYGSMFGGFPGVINSVDAVDDYTVEITLNQPQAPFLNTMGMNNFAFSSPTAIKKYGDDYFNHPTGTGPFKFVEWRRESSITLERNEDYWGDNAYLDSIVFRVIPDNAARFLELQAGAIDLMDGMNPQDVPLAKQDPNIQLIKRPSFNVGYLAMNLDHEPFGDVRVRRAVNYAINKEPIIEALLGDMGQTAKNPLPPALWGYNDDIVPYGYDPEKARELLAEAGYPNGFETTLWAMPNPRPYMPEPRLISEALQADLADVGIDVEIVSYDWATYLEKTQYGEHDMALLGWTGDNGDPDNFLYVLLDKDNAVVGAANNIAFYRSDELHEVLIEAQQVSDIDRRTELYERAQEIIHRDAPWVPLLHTTPALGAKKTVHGFVPHPTSAEVLVDVWIEH